LEDDFARWRSEKKTDFHHRMALRTGPEPQLGYKMIVNAGRISAADALGVTHSLTEHDKGFTESSSSANSLPEYWYSGPISHCATALVSCITVVRRQLCRSASSAEVPMSIQTELGITGRDSYIINKALAIAVAMIDAQPLRQRELSDREDMVTILMATATNKERDALAMAVGSRYGTTPKLSPYDDSTWKELTEQ